MKTICFTISVLLIIFETTACKSVAVPSLIEPNTALLESEHTSTCIPIYEKNDEGLNDSVISDDVRIIDGEYTVKYDLVDISIRFPQLDGFQDENLEDKINELIYSSVITQAETKWGGFRYEVNITYEITYISQKYISIVFSGNKSDERYNSYKQALTINLKTAERIFLSEFFTVGEVQIMINSLTLTEKCRIIDMFGVEWTGSRELISELCIEQFGEIKDYSWGGGFYLRDDKLGLIVSVTDSEYVSAEFETSTSPWN